ncbi:MAG TPA: ABC transporter ATP-binding protein [Solirubrobacteraceae bacterium]|jgi:iron(III) transport system ATP-binding protein|nr:ABC transporter ATP-binding protein [Solirubrobacteraceae bacterium]
MSVIELRGVAKRFGVTPVLTDVDLTVPAASLTAVLGASGSGKTTLLRLIAGFEQLDAGTIAIDGQILDDGRRSVRPQHRGVGYVPQDGALFPHLTVIGNVGFGLPKRERPGATALLELVGLTGLERRYPHELSGGQQQRVALARALAIRPSIVLLDEPFSSLDASLRGELGRDVARILTEAQTTSVLVTHDQDEALALSDQIAVLEAGRIVARAEPRALYRDPPDLTAATSIGEANVLSAQIQADRAHCALGAVPFRTRGAPALDGPCRLLLRPEQLTLHLHADNGAAPATVIAHHYHGHDGVALFKLDHHKGETLLARVPGEVAFTPGQRVWVQVNGQGLLWPS